MADGQNLLRPLRSDSLTPRPSTQAVWEPGKAVPELPAETKTADSGLMHTPVLPDFAPLHAPDPLSEGRSEEEAGLPQDILIDTSFDDPDEDDSSDEPDAIPTEQMPEPACVPLYEENPPKRRGHGWLWFLVLIVLAVGGVYAAWFFGCLPINLP